MGVGCAVAGDESMQENFGFLAGESAAWSIQIEHAARTPGRTRTGVWQAAAGLMGRPDSFAPMGWTTIKVRAGEPGN